MEETMLNPNSRPTEMLSVRFPVGAGRKISKLAEQLGLSRSELVRQTLREQYVELRLSGAIVEEDGGRSP